MANEKCPADCAMSPSSGGATSYSDYAPSDIPSSLPSSFFERQFMDSLVSFMKECHSVYESFKSMSGSKEFVLSEEERQAKIQELMVLIAEKERELSSLEAQRVQLLSNYDPSSGSSGVAPQSPPHSTPKRVIGDQEGYTYAQTRSGNICVVGCQDNCNTDYFQYSGYAAAPPRALPPRIHSTPVRRGVRPPVFTTSMYNSTGECDPNCSESCNDSLVQKYMQKLM